MEDGWMDGWIGRRVMIMTVTGGFLTGSLIEGFRIPGEKGWSPGLHGFIGGAASTGVSSGHYIIFPLLIDTYIEWTWHVTS
ncbi:hypothetical protein BKA61DRAFT_625575 [Leptodontidium sp. MPI-SDFR-AT-0119]|nr:hypothetical protein BKA61DRAFT_625575 [Leptodontidium sp. MPI-SDFR-AT-0119]